MATKTLIATFEMFKNFKTYPTNEYLALSEFIDNAISSWQGRGNENYPIKGLKIEITLDKTKNDEKIIIKDNAKGMGEEELLNALQPANRVGKNDSYYNQYGMGMKVGAFWYGQDVTIFTKEKNLKEYCVEVICSSKEGSEEAVVESIESNQNKILGESGTIIEISNIYKELGRSWTAPKFYVIKEALGWRYNKLIKDGMEIWIKIDVGKEGESPILIEPYLPKFYKLSDFLNKKQNKNINIQKLKDKIYNDIDDMKANQIDKGIENYQNKLVINGRNILEIFCDKLLNDEELFCEIDTNILKKDNTKVKFTFGIIEYTNNYSKYTGVTTYHLKRAINHGPNPKKSTNLQESGNISFKTSNVGSTGDPTFRRLIGNIDLSNTNIITDTNKGKLIWNPDDDDHFNELMSKIWTSLKSLLRKMIDWEEFKTNLTEIQKDEKKMNNIINHSNDVINEDKIKLTLEKDNESFKPIFRSYNNTKIEIKEQNIIDKNKVIWIQREKDRIIINININHKFWNEMLSDQKISEIFRGQCLYPFVLVIALCDSWTTDKKLIGEIIEKHNESTFMQIINQVCFELEKRDNDDK